MIRANYTGRNCIGHAACIEACSASTVATETEPHARDER
jgi:NAD-dependent dihydropyrimidine dehydrogenase PreA subunit